MQALSGSFAQPDDTKSFPNGSEDIVNINGTPVGCMTLQPGWRWSNDLRPLVGSELCPLTHAGYVLKGHLHVEVEDGSTLDIGPGDVYLIPPRHDAWVVGDDAYTALDWAGKAREFATKAQKAIGGSR